MKSRYSMAGSAKQKGSETAHRVLFFGLKLLSKKNCHFKRLPSAHENPK